MTIQEKIKALEEKQAELVKEQTELAKEIKALKQEQENKPKGRYDWLEDGSSYYWIAGSGNVCKMRWDGRAPDYGSLSVGNVFRTPDEAEFEVERLKVIHELKEFSRPFKLGEANFYIYFDYVCNNIKVSGSKTYQLDNIHFESGKIAQQAIEAVGKDKIIKYYFRIED